MFSVVEECRRFSPVRRPIASWTSVLKVAAVVSLEQYCWPLRPETQKVVPQPWEPLPASALTLPICSTTIVGSLMKSTISS